MVCGCHRVHDATRPDEDGVAVRVIGCHRADVGGNPSEGGVVVMVNDGDVRGREGPPSSQSRNQNRKR
jgi:hypothetical protein